MTQRYTKVFIQRRFEMVMKELGLPVGTNEGDFTLDYYSYGGGWMIVQMGRNGGHRTPFGLTRYKPSAFVDVLGVMRDTAQLMRNKP